MFPDLPMNEEAHLIEPERDQELVTVTLLKQYIYCPRVVYYETCTPGIRPRTYKMQAGSEAHDRERERAARRTLTAYQISEGERHFDVRIISRRLGLSGMIDEIVLTPHEAIVIDYKLTGRARDNHLIQIGAYGMMVEEAFNLPVQRGYIYLIDLHRFESVPIDGPLRNSVLETLKSMDRIRLYEYMPPPVESRFKCESCEFRRFCNDI
ncbi:MAG: CRISPR-associated protein Cas4 [Anaerolineae bacterium]|nr:CRISPR-associated protein Cas4 [Anaerolineae bacterium]